MTHVRVTTAYSFFYSILLLYALFVDEYRHHVKYVSVNLLPPPACCAENPRGCGARLVLERHPQRVESRPRESLLA